MFQVSNEEIFKKCTPLIFNKGKDYYRQEKVKSINFSQTKISFDAVVLGTKRYNVLVNFNDEGEATLSNCTCSIFKNNKGICEHIVAVMLVIKDKDEQGFFDQLKLRQAAKQIFNFFESKSDSTKIPVELEVTFEYHKGKLSDRGTYSSLSLRIGQDKLYIVRDIKRLFEGIGKNQEMEFGKGFSFDPSRHTFKDEDQSIILLLKELYETEKMVDKFSLGYGRGSVFKEKQVMLAPIMVKKFFEIMGDRPFKAEIQEVFYEEMTIIKQDFPLEFIVAKEGNNLLLNIKHEEPLIPLTEEGEYFLAGNSIYKTSIKQQENFKPFYAALLRQKGQKIIFSAGDKERFVSEVLPFAEKAGKVVIDEKVQSLIEKIDIETEIYLDRSGETITAEVKFVYEEKVFNPFAPINKDFHSGEKILLRDIEKERLITDILAETEFRVKNGQIYLDEEEKIFDFIFNTIPKLQEHANIFYSETFKNTVIKETSSFSGGIRLNSDTNMLEFNFNIDGINRSELASIFTSLKENKKYYRLKNGTFVPLNSKGIKDISDIIEYLDISKKDLQKEFIQVPKFRALYLDQYLKRSGLKYIQRNHAFKELVQNIGEPEDTEIATPKGIKGTLREYQKFGFKWLKTMSAYDMGGILADDMGLGKTLQIITLLLSEKDENRKQPSLVVVPTSLVYNWYSEIEKFAPDLKALIISGDKEERQKQMLNMLEADVVITSYPLIRRDIDEYRNMEFFYCILDEAQYIKNPNSQNAKSVKEIKSKKRFALTGTPMENALSELWSIFDFVLPGYLFSHSKFVQKYEKPIIKDANTKVLEDLGRHIKPFILRRLKSEVLHELPEKIEHKMVAELTEEQKKVYLAYLQQIKSEIEKDIEDNGFQKSQIKILAGLTRLRQICCHPSVFLDEFEGESGKMLLLQEIVQDSIGSGHRILLFSQFTSMLHIIKDWLRCRKIEYLYLDGSTKTEERGKLVKAFNEGRGEIFLISLKAGGTGLNLTGADTVIHYDPWWNPAVEDQATDRAYRIGQLKSVHVMKLVTKGTIEEKIFNLQENKKRLIDSVIQPGETMLTKMSEEDVRSLFE